MNLCEVFYVPSLDEAVFSQSFGYETEKKKTMEERKILLSRNVMKREEDLEAKPNQQQEDCSKSPVQVSRSLSISQLKAKQGQEKDKENEMEREKKEGGKLQIELFNLRKKNSNRIHNSNP